MINYTLREQESYKRIKGEISKDRKVRRRKKPQYYQDLKKYKLKKKLELEDAIMKQKKESERNKLKLEFRNKNAILNK